ncbi:YadA-like family protein [Photobacterium swingsii]|uniref:YadA-like family protein n=1 Tax=Photobacterium swingsii TaxID=680026 RepID=UPI00352D4023
MKKSIIALSMLSILASGSALAAKQDDVSFYNVKDVENKIDQIEKEGKLSVTRTDKVVKITSPVDGRTAYFIKDDNGKYRVHTHIKGENSRFDIETANGEITKITDGNGKDISDIAIKKDETKVLPEPDAKSNESQIKDNKARIDAIIDGVDNFYKNNAEAVAKEYTSAAKHVAKQDARISTLEQDFSKMAERQDALEKRVDKVEKKMDSVMAGVHAVTNARPFVQNGQTAVGVGTGFAGSAQSVAIGAAHSFDDSAWSMSASMNVTTGSGVKTDVSGGVGAHYVF